MDIQIAKEIYLTNLDSVKKILDLIEFKEGKASEEFKYLKRELFNYFYSNIQKLFKKLEEQKIITRCPNNCSLRQGWTSCPHCSGSGYYNYEN